MLLPLASLHRPATHRLVVSLAERRAAAKAPRKGQLPTKICETCGLPFEYRKKWAKVLLPLAPAAAASSSTRDHPLQS